MMRFILIGIVVVIVLAILLRRKQPPPLLDEVLPVEKMDHPELRAGEDIRRDMARESDETTPDRRGDA